MGFKKDEVESIKCYKGKGCPACNGTGYKGRIALYEVMPVKEEIKEMIIKGATATDLKKTAISSGMKSLRLSGLAKIKEGMTSVQEVLRVTFSD